ncbi:lytic transglycosylase domain-containing protein [Paenibacillus pasadenensis]|uniref:lytic transglycosylase domain-containing protein n=1 Tax=Paenibacillus pasadenensis TaxID=217090 RepID=UPI00203BB67A|nr:lytic transglycosylase domain-containing protein [Paenibacillus pasadenensis]
MSIDPRTLTALMKLQLKPSLDTLLGGSSGSGAVSETGSSFDQILNQLASATGGLNETALDQLQPELSTGDVTNVFGSVSLDTSAGSGIGPANLQAALIAAGMNTEASGSQTGGSPFEGLIGAAAAKYGLSPSLIRSVIDAESSFNPLAESHAGAKGLMQLMDGTARGLGVTDSFDPAQNIDAGSKYLAYLLRKFDGSIPAALAGYNAGPGRLDRLGISDEATLKANYESLPRETQQYVIKIMNKLGASL